MTPTPARREQVGNAVAHERARRDWSVETAIIEGGVGHMTWRRIERGETVRARSYRAVDLAFGYPVGHTLSVVDSDDDTLVLGDVAPSNTPLADAALLLSDRRTGETDSSPLDVTLDLLDQLTLSDLRTLRTITQQYIDGKESILSSIHAALDSVRAPSWETRRHLYLLSRETVERYHELFASYLDIWHSVDELTREVRHIERNSAVSRDDLHDLYQRVNTATGELTHIRSHLDAIEQEALRELRENNIDPQLEGST